ncbi:MAG TPA: tetratricopeptide repeat protein, partial [Thermoanaerobaculia bacterium]|nr:tetratricopeptide repeat protein [Thermoanaerobaculia bacterium]
MNRNARLLTLAMGLYLLAGSAGAAGSRSDEGAELFAARKFEQARLSLELAVRENPGDARAASYLGRVYLAQGSPGLAVEWMEESIAIEPSSTEYHLWLGRAYGYQAIRAAVLKQPSLAKKVRKEFEQASALDPDNLEARFGLIEFYLQAPGILGGSEKKAKEQAQE